MQGASELAHSQDNGKRTTYPFILDQLQFNQCGKEMLFNRFLLALRCKSEITTAIILDLECYLPLMIPVTNSKI